MSTASNRAERPRVLSKWWRLKIERTTLEALTQLQRDELWSLTCSVVKRDRAELEAKLARCQALWLVRSSAAAPIEGLFALRVWASPDPAKPVALMEVGLFWLAAQLRGLHLPVILGFLALLWAIREYPNKRRFFVGYAVTEYTFLMLHRYLVAWPHPDREIPPELQAELEPGLRALVGDDWNPKTGIRAGHGRLQYKAIRPPGVYGSKEMERLAAWYYARNPGHAGGDGLTMIVPVDLRQTVSSFATVGRELARSLFGLGRARVSRRS